MAGCNSTPGARNIVLTGFMGTGKSTVGRILAERLQRPFLDMDAEIERLESRTVSDVFAADGEAAFRAIERRLVEELSRRQGLVIATGGGVVMNPANRRDFERSGLLVCLNASPDCILKRVAHDTQRPLLAGGDQRRRICDLLAARRSAYASVKLQIDTDDLTPGRVADRIIAKLNSV